MNGKRIISFLLMVMIAMTSFPITAYASPVTGNTGGGTDGGSGNGGSMNLDSFSVSVEKQGYRLTFVDSATGEKVGNTVDILRSPQPSGLIFKSSAASDDDFKQAGASNYKSFLYSDLEPGLSKLVKEYRTIPWWLVEERRSDSTSIKDWLLSDIAAANLSGSLYALNVGAEASKNKHSIYTDEVLTTDDMNIVVTDSTINAINDMKETLNLSVKEHVVYGLTAVHMMEAMLDEAEKKLANEGKIIVNVEEHEAITNFKKYLESGSAYMEARSENTSVAADVFKTFGVDEAMKTLESRADAAENVSPVITAGSGETVEGSALPDGSTPNKKPNGGGTIVDSGPGSMGSENEEDTKNPNKGLDGESIWQNQKASMESGSFDAAMYGYVLPLIYTKVGGDYAFTAGTGITVDELGAKFLTNEISLILEPVLWCKPRKYPEGINFTHHVYGTPRNWAYAALGPVKSAWGYMSDLGLENWRTINAAFFCALQLDNNEAELAPTQNNRTPLWGDAPYVSSIGTRQNKKGIECYSFSHFLSLVEKGGPLIGVGMHIYACKAAPSTKLLITTPEKPDLPDWPGGGPIKVIKYYQTRFSSKHVVPHSYHVLENAPREIQIQGDEKEWQYIGYYTSTTDYKIPHNGNPLEWTWEKSKKDTAPGTYAGTKPGTLYIPETDPDKTVLILYERTPVIKKTITVIRVYDSDEDGTPEKVETEITEDNPYTVPIDPEYTYVETKITDNPPKPTESWDDSEGDSQGTPPDVQYPDSTQTIYIHYIKPNKPEAQRIVLYENELSYNYDLRDLLKNRKLIEIYDNVPAADFDPASCPGHRRGNSHNGYYYVYCSNNTKGMTDSQWTVSVKDSFNQNSLPFIKQWTYTSSMSATGNTSGKGGEGRSAIVKPQATFLVIRDKQKDVVTLYPGKNEGIKGELQDLNLTESYTSADTRYKNKRETSATEKFYNTIKTQLGDGPGRDTHLSWWTKLTGYGTHSNSGSYNTSYASGHSPSDANTAYSKPDNFETRYFLGKAGKSEEEPKDIRSAWMKKFNHNTAYSKTSANLSFYPYLKYVYYRKDSSSAEPVMVTSSNLSEFKVYNAIQAGVYKKREINANLDSTQWSTHARSLSFLKSYGISDKRSVLPGGAIMDIDTFNPGDTQIGLTIWQTCLPDTQVQAVQEGFKVSESEAREATNALIESVKKSISGYGLVQWGETGIYKDMKSLMKVAEELHEKTRVSFVKGNNGTTQADNKYYLRHDGEGSNRANFDCLDSRIENQHVYTIYSDVEGNVWVTKDGTEIGRISKTEKADSLLSNAEIKILDDNTKVITNYVTVIQRNAGTTRDGEKWHNEAFDGVSVLMTEISFDVGFGGNSAKRTNVLDPLLTAPTQSKSDLYNFSDEDLVRSSVYVTTKTSSQADKKQEGYLGTLKGISGIGDLETGLTDIQSMVYTKNFYIPNATVSDLN